MILTTWRTYFDILQDKYGSPYFTDTEKELLFQRAIMDFVDSHFSPSKKGTITVEANQRIMENLSTIVFRLPAIKMDSAGLITVAQLNTALGTIVTGGSAMRTLGLGWEQSAGYTVPIKLTRHNDWYEFKQNYFKDAKRGSAPRYYMSGSNFYVEPINTAVNIRVTIVKYPATVAFAGPVECDLPDFTHNSIIASALEMAGVSSRDEALTQLLALHQGKFDSARYEV